MRKEIQPLIANGTQQVHKLDQWESMPLEQIKTALDVFKNLVTELQGRIQAYDIQKISDSGKKIKKTFNKNLSEIYWKQLSKLSCHDDPENYNDFLMNNLVEPDIREQAKKDCEAEQIGWNCVDYPNEYDMFLESVKVNDLRKFGRALTACSRAKVKYRQNIQQEKK